MINSALTLNQKFRRPGTGATAETSLEIPAGRAAAKNWAGEVGRSPRGAAKRSPPGAGGTSGPTSSELIHTFAGLLAGAATGARPRAGGDTGAVGGPGGGGSGAAGTGKARTTGGGGISAAPAGGGGEATADAGDGGSLGRAGGLAGRGTGVGTVRGASTGTVANSTSSGSEMLPGGVRTTGDVTIPCQAPASSTQPSSATKSVPPRPTSMNHPRLEARSGISRSNLPPAAFRCTRRTSRLAAPSDSQRRA